MRIVRSLTRLRRAGDDMLDDMLDGAVVFCVNELVLEERIL
jgi:hypothetical protein